MRRLLKPGGVVLIEVPNFGGWEGRLGGPAWFHLDLPRHLFHFEEPSLARLLQQHGFEARRWETFSLEYGAFGFAQTVLNRVCSRPNHLFQTLIRRGSSTVSSRKDTMVSIVGLPTLLAVGMVGPSSRGNAGRRGAARVGREAARRRATPTVRRPRVSLTMRLRDQLSLRRPGIRLSKLAPALSLTACCRARGR